MTTVVPFDSAYARAMAKVVAEARRNTHLIIATHRDTGEVRSWHARPRRQAIEYRDATRRVLDDRWIVRAVPVRRFR